MVMDAKKLEQSAKIYNQVKKLDAEIIELESMAEQLLHEETTSIIKIDIEKCELKADSLTYGIDSGRGSSGITFGAAIFPIGFLDSFNEEYKKRYPVKNNQSSSHDLTNNETLLVLGTLIHIKQNNRNSLLLELEKLGVKI